MTLLYPALRSPGEPDPQDPLTDTDPPEDFDTMPNTFEAQWPGECQCCPVRIKKGDEIVPVGNSGYAHAVCPEAQVLDLTTPNGVCNDCHQALPVSKICGWC